MAKLLAKFFIKNYKNVNDPNVCDNYGIVGSFFGIVTNAILVILKLVVGFIFSSMSIISDALNNLADFGNSTVAIIGFKISKKPGDKDHPFGHERVQYISSLIIALVIIVFGVIALVESIHSIIGHIGNFNYDIPDNRDLLLLIPLLSVAILIKVLQAFVYKGFYKATNIITFKGLFADSFNDTLSTFGVIISVLIAYFTNINIDAFVGAVISLVVIKSGVSIGYQTSKVLIGEKPDKDIIDKFIAIIKQYPSVLGMHDLEMHCYGAHKIYASIHVEVDSRQNIMDIHEIIDDIEKRCDKELGIRTIIHMDPVLVNDEETKEYKEMVMVFFMMVAKL